MFNLKDIKQCCIKHIYIKYVWYWLIVKLMILKFNILTIYLFKYFNTVIRIYIYIYDAFEFCII